MALDFFQITLAPLRGQDFMEKGRVDKAMGSRDGALLPPWTPELSESPGLSRRATDGERDGGTAGQAAKEPKYVLYPLISPTSRTRPITPLVRYPEGSGSTTGVAETMDRTMSTKRSRSVRNLLGSTRFRRKDSSVSKPKPGLLDPLSPMTTVVEMPMDSPTIPGHYPVHERSNSAPGWGRQGTSGEVTTPGPISPTEKIQPNRKGPWPMVQLGSPIKRKPVSPARIQKLVISPAEVEPWRTRTPRSDNTPKQSRTPAPQTPPKDSRKDTSPRAKELGTLANVSTISLLSSTRVGTPMTASEQSFHSSAWGTPTTAVAPLTHQRLPSEGSAVGRGRSARREDDELSPQSKTFSANASIKGKSVQILPCGFSAVNAPAHLAPEDVTMLREQALGQAARFEVLGVKDVARLAKELRSLDERCEYLRKSQSAMRSERQTLHVRMITYLQSPRLTQFSREDMLRQEQGLAQLDAALDAHFTKLEQSENRRTRIRQKLLEHVAAATTLQTSLPSSSSSSSLSFSPVTPDNPAIDPSSSLPSSLSSPKHRGDRVGGLVGLGVGILDEDTPPRTPSDRPHTSASASSPSSLSVPQHHIERKDVESIRVYADSNVYALFADVEQEISRMAVRASGGGTNGRG